MKKYHFVHVPNQDMFSGLVHGSFHALRTCKDVHEREGQLAVVYVDITAHAATSALYAILKRPHIYGMMPCSYIDNRSVRGFTAAREFSIFLSPSLNHVEPKQLGADLLRFFDAVEQATHTQSAAIEVYLTSSSTMMIDSLREAAYERYLKSDAQDIVCGNQNKSNIALADVAAMIERPKLITDDALPKGEIVLGDEYSALNMYALGKFLDICNSHGKRIVLSKKLHHEYFRQVICKY